ncbi:MAG: thiamine phosphate synthase [Bacteroidales bacterium]|jgi:thiamine-phosphate pyrophosphorylase|nr:thiamine phosphate synthase [Bacteroidales bacterium]
MADRIIFITHKTEEFNHLDCVQIALDAGLKLIQLRLKSDVSNQEKVETIEKARVRCRVFGASLTIDDDVRTAKRMHLSGVHLGKNDMPIADARIILGENVLIGATANTLSDVLKASRNGANYIGLGPFRHTTTKEKLEPILGLKGYKNIMSSVASLGVKQPIYAIGGIELDDVESLMKIGFYGVAVSSAILSAPNPVVAARQFKRVVEQYKLSGSLEE